VTHSQNPTGEHPSNNAHGMSRRLVSEYTSPEASSLFFVAGALPTSDWLGKGRTLKQTTAWSGGKIKKDR